VFYLSYDLLTKKYLKNLVFQPITKQKNSAINLIKAEFYF